MKTKILITVLFLTVSLSAQDMRTNGFRSLFSDEKANKLGDAITILVMESSEAANNAQTSAGRSSNIDFGLSGGLDQTALPNADIGVGSDNDFSGSGTTKSSGMVRTRLTATIDSVLANGNLFITGSRKISINGEEQLVKIQGIVRTADIASDNTVKSYNISNAEIIIEGSGMIDRMQSPGWVTKLFHWLF